MIENIKWFFSGRPHWMNALMLFCGYMTFFYMPFDFFYKPVAEDQEVWFGYMLHGWAAKATEPIHWAIYGAGFYGFLKMKPWMFPWASLYVFQVAIAFAVWGVLYGDTNPLVSAVFAIPFVILGIMLWRSRDRFNGMDATAAQDETREEVTDEER